MDKPLSDKSCSAFQVSFPSHLNLNKPLMCLTPVTIINPSKFINLSRRDQILLQVPCGHCAECRATLSNQWLLRTYQEFSDCLSSHQHSYVYYDTLTYNAESLPTIRDVISDFPDPDSFPIFNSQHTHRFLDNLQKKLQRNFDTSFRYFLSSEYGDKKGRPHYHLLLFVYGNIEPLKLSAVISELWKYGRTDGFPYRSQYYVETHNVIKDKSKETWLRTSNYVTKYVQKSCKYDKLLFERIESVIDFVDKKMASTKQLSLGEFKNSNHCKSFREKLKRRVSQYHRQSQQFGASLLSEIDLNQLVRDGVLYMPHPKYVTLAVPLPMYYKRKLFQEQITIDGMRCWHDTQLGKWYKASRRPLLQKKLQHRYKCIALQHNYMIPAALSDYVLNRRGRIVAPLDPSSDLYDRLENVDLFLYASKTDVRRFNKVIISDRYFGNSTKGYTTPRGAWIDKDDFIHRCVYLDCKMEESLDKLQTYIKPFNERKNNLMSHLQRLRQVHKDILNDL